MTDETQSEQSPEGEMPQESAAIETPDAGQTQPPVSNEHVAVGAEPFAHLDPTIEQALEMFKLNPGLAHVVTTEGGLSRDGVLTPRGQ